MGVSTYPTPATVRLVRRQSVFTASGTFTAPTSALGNMVEALVVGGGASGSSGGTNTGCGGNGGEVIRRRVSITPGASLAVVVGAGGVKPAPSVSAAGTAGQASTFAGVTARGGLAVSNWIVPVGIGAGMGQQYLSTGTGPLAASDGAEGYSHGGRTISAAAVAVDAQPNTGDGGIGIAATGTNAAQQPGSGGSGIVIVEWDELV